jgi:predicted MPP superfamily phosphohydrolase
MALRSVFLLYVAIGLAVLGFAQVYLLVKWRRLLWRTPLRLGLRQFLFTAACAFVVLMYTPYPLQFLYKWSDQEVSPVVLYTLLYPFSLWGIISVSTFLIVLLRDCGVTVWRRWQSKPAAQGALGETLVEPQGTTRREFLRLGFGAVALSPVGVFTYGAAIGKEHYELVERTIKLPRLSPALAGLRIVQLTDIHVGNFMKQAKLERIVQVANDLNPHLIALTGDFIGSSAHFIPACATALEKLEARDGVFACLGNHDHWVGAQRVTEALQAAGVEVLRNQARRLSIHGAPVNVAGVDDPWRGHTDFDRALSMCDPHAPTIMLCHQPDLFPAVVQRDIDLTLAGHYHGGQVTFQFLGLRLSPAHLVSDFVEGLYARGRSQLYVSRGIGITGPPARLNAAPEITLLHLT